MLVLTSLGVEAVPRTESVGLSQNNYFSSLIDNAFYKRKRWILEVFSGSFICLFVIVVVPKAIHTN